MQITAKIICDSRSPDHVRLTTFQLTYPRFIHSEFMTHRAFSRNASSSRAIPVRKVLQQVWSNPAMPVAWGSNQPGMQAGADLIDWRRSAAPALWRTAGKFASAFAWGLMKLGVHKQLSNRILEPWQLINVVVTATDFENFFALRDHPDAQPEIRALARAMLRALEQSTPDVLMEGQWHLPYVTTQDYADLWGDSYMEWLLPVLSAARCARVSYNNHDGTSPDRVKDQSLFETLALADPAHASPTEHQARVCRRLYRSRNFQGAWEQFREVLELKGWGPYGPTGDTGEIH